MIRVQSPLLHRMFCLAAAVALGAALVATGGAARAAADTVDEIHYSFGSAPYGTTPDSVVFDWRGTETLIEYATETDYNTNVLAGAPDPYNLQATATPPTPLIVPVDDPGPFQEVRLSGLTAGTTYHYRIGADGLDHTFRTTPTDDFTWVDIGDTGTTTPFCNMTWMSSEQALVAAQSPSFVTHGGDISYANECGVPAVHQYFMDQQVWSEDAAFMPVWGNHEYGPPTSTAPFGTPRDSLANYKGRVAISNPQTLSVDTSSRTTNPGCGANGINTCQGEDWGWFVAGHVLLISYPEPWTNAYTDWEPVAQNLMDQAQADPKIDFIVTYGHRPAYSSVSSEVVPALRTALTTLSNLYSPTPANPQGKYILNISHHVHAEEVFSPIGGLVNITNGGGGAGQSSLTTPAAGSIFRATHPAILSAHYDATAHTLRVDVLCGPDYAPNPKYVCPNGPGSSIYSQTFYPPSPALRATIDDGITTPTAGQPVTYVMTATASLGTAPGVTMTATLPPGYSINDAGDGTVNGSTITWALNDIPAGTTVTKSVATTFTSGSPGSSLQATVQLQDTGGVCANANSTCSATDTDTLPPTITQWVTNPSVETSLSGWTGWNSASVLTRTTADAYVGIASLQVARNSGSGAAGFSSKPKVVTSTVLGKQYTAGVEVEGKAVGQVITLMIKETTPGGATVGSKTVSINVPNLGWNAMPPLVYTAIGAGNALTFSVYGGNLPTGGWFRADAMSLTSPN